MDSLRRPPSAFLIPLLAFLIIAGAPRAEAEWEAGMEAFQQGRFPDAVREFGQTTESHPDYAAGHYMLGLALNKVQRPSEAIASLEKACRLAPDKASYTLTLAQTLVQVKRPGDALTALGAHSVAKLEPRLRSTYVTTMAAAGTQTEAATALPVLQKAAAQFDASADLWLALGAVASKQGALEQAFKAYEQALRLDPSRESLGRTTMTTALRLAEQAATADEGKAWYRRAAEVGQSSSLADLGESSRSLPGEAWLKAGDAEAARTWFEKMLQAQPGDAAARLGLARSLLDLGEPEAALVELQRAAKTSPDAELSASIQRRLGFTYHQLQRYDQAAAAYLAGGDAEKAQEMKSYQEIADGNRTIDRMREECQEKAQRIAAIKAKQKDVFPAAEWAAIERDLNLSLADCRPYLDAT